MRKYLLIAFALSTSVQSADNSYWEEVFNTSMKRQAEAKLANFSDFPLDKEPSSTFGMRLHPITQENKLHHGVDFPGNEGDPFKVVAHGDVIFAGDNGSLGMTISVDHGNGLVTRYGHARSLNFAVGDKVRRGDEIGTIGATGMVTGPHLHFEVIQDGEHIDPQAFIAQRRAMTIEDYRNHEMETPSVDIDSYVQYQLTNNKAISNETFDGFAVEKAVSDFETSINQNQVVASAATLQVHVDEFAENNAQQISNQVAGEKFDDFAVEESQPDEASFEQATVFESKPEMQIGDTPESVVGRIDDIPATEAQQSTVDDPGIYTKRTLWAIADEIKPLHATVYQSMFAIFELNPHAFSNGNMNQRYLDTPIKLPDSLKITAVDPEMAKSKYYGDLARLTDAKQLDKQEAQTAPQ